MGAAHVESVGSIWFYILRDLEGFMMSIFPREDDLKNELTRHLWNYIFNGAVESIGKQDSDRGIARYKSKIDFWRRT